MRSRMIIDKMRTRKSRRRMRREMIVIKIRKVMIMRKWENDEDFDHGRE